MTGALWAKRGERDISRGARHEREARDEGKRKIKGRNQDFTERGSIVGPPKRYLHKFCSKVRQYYIKKLCEFFNSVMQNVMQN